MFYLYKMYQSGFYFFLRRTVLYVKIIQFRRELAKDEGIILVKQLSLLTTYNVKYHSKTVSKYVSSIFLFYLTFLFLQLRFHYAKLHWMVEKAKPRYPVTRQLNFASGKSCDVHVFKLILIEARHENRNSDIKQIKLKRSCSKCKQIYCVFTLYLCSPNAKNMRINPFKESGCGLCPEEAGEGVKGDNCVQCGGQKGTACNAEPSKIVSFFRIFLISLIFCFILFHLFFIFCFILFFFSGNEKFLYT